MLPNVTLAVAVPAADKTVGSSKAVVTTPSRIVLAIGVNVIFEKIGAVVAPEIAKSIFVFAGNVYVNEFVIVQSAIVTSSTSAIANGVHATLNLKLADFVTVGPFALDATKPKTKNRAMIDSKFFMVVS